MECKVRWENIYTFITGQWCPCKVITQSSPINLSHIPYEPLHAQICDGPDMTILYT